jgi:hypothetical protein
MQVGQSISGRPRPASAKSTTPESAVLADQQIERWKSPLMKPRRRSAGMAARVEVRAAQSPPSAGLAAARPFSNACTRSSSGIEASASAAAASWWSTAMDSPKLPAKRSRSRAGSRASRSSLKGAPATRVRRIQAA